VVVYKANPITVAVARQVVRVSFISLVNLINNYLSVIELIQKECTSHNIAEELDRLVNDAAHRSSILENYDVLREKMGDPGASERTASLIFNYLKKEHQ
ncbi:MAG: lipid-A-disaccharide synthase, partial [Sphingobacterium sp.]